jgi:hypothetical protein
MTSSPTSATPRESSLARREVAQRAGADLEFVSRLTELGILSPDDDDRFSPGDVRRVMIVRTLA